MDVVRAVNDSQPDPARRRRAHRPDRLQPLHQQPASDDRARSTDLPLKTVGTAPRCSCAMSARPRTPQQIQTNIVRVDGQRSVYLPVLKQGGDTNTIAVVDGIKKAVAGLCGHPEAARRERRLRPVGLRRRRRSRTCSTRAPSAWSSPALMILLFLGSVRATVAVFLSIPLSALAAFSRSRSAAAPSTRWSSAAWRWLSRA